MIVCMATYMYGEGDPTDNPAKCMMGLKRQPIIMKNSYTLSQWLELINN